MKADRRVRPLNVTLQSVFPELSFSFLSAFVVHKIEWEGPRTQIYYRFKALH